MRVSKYFWLSFLVVILVSWYYADAAETSAPSFYDKLVPQTMWTHAFTDTEGVRIYLKNDQLVYDKRRDMLAMTILLDSRSSKAYERSKATFVENSYMVLCSPHVASLTARTSYNTQMIAFEWYNATPPLKMNSYKEGTIFSLLCAKAISTAI